MQDWSRPTGLLEKFWSYDVDQVNALTYVVYRSILVYEGTISMICLIHVNVKVDDREPNC